MNNNFMRQGQGNRNRNRNRNGNNNNNRHRTGGGGGGPNNKVFDSNGPDVKVRGTAQTIAEKYMQLGRDAQSSGDSVAAETYYQHAEHYYRVWAANQPVGASLIMSRKLGEEEFEEEGGAEDSGEDDGVEGNGENVVAEAAEGQEAVPGEGQAQGEAGFPQRRPNNNRNRDEQRDGNRERFRPRWQRGRDRFQQDGNGESPEQVAGVEQVPVVEPVQPVETQWEAPSFLQRPPPPVVEVTEAVAQEAPVRRPRARKPKAEEQVAIVETVSQPE